MCFSHEHLLFLSVCTGIRQLQLVLLKVALLLGVEVHVNVEFKKLVEPPEGQEDNSKINQLISVIVLSLSH